MDELQRITTQFVPVEDRIRLAGEGAVGNTHVLWLTRRLADRLMPVLLRWLEERMPTQDSWQAGLMQSFAQQAASVALMPQVPVHGDVSSTSWLVAEVDIVRGERQLELCCKGAAGEQVSLVLESQPLRQWPGIIHKAYRQAEWPLAVWPQWLVESGGPMALAPLGTMH